MGQGIGDLDSGLTIGKKISTHISVSLKSLGVDVSSSDRVKLGLGDSGEEGGHI